MPPPTIVDSWLAARRFGIIVDAGSSGSRSQIYSWIDPRVTLLEKGDAVAHTLPKVEKGARDGKEWVSKVEPGLSSFADNPDGLEQYLVPLLLHARENIPPSLHKETPLFLLATAGMRLLSPIQQASILKSTCQFLRLHSDFRIDDPSDAGPCGSSVRIITGEEEGLFGWIAVNYLMDGFAGSSANRTTFGFLDMGGASTQIAFEPKPGDRSLAKKLIDVRLRLLGGEEIHHQVFVTTWLGYGTNQARERYVGLALEEHRDQHVSNPHRTSDADAIPDPCLPKHLERMEKAVHTGRGSSHHPRHHHLVGTGSFEECLRKTSSLLNKDVPCPDSPCLFNGVHVPPIDFSVSHFIGVSEYWYSSEHVFGLGGAYDFVQYERAASNFCAQEWSGILKQHEESRRTGRLGGDGEVVEAGRVVATGKWGKEVELSRLETQCFKAAWIVNVLHEGLGMPRIVDPGGNSTTDAEMVAEQAARKGLGRPTFRSAESVGDIAITWTLGKMVLEASKEVPPISRASRPLVDPLDDIADPANAPVKPIRPPFFDLDYLENHLSQHLPSSLHRDALGFSPVFFLAYCALIVVMAVAYRLRHSIIVSCRRTIHSRNKRNRNSDASEYRMEEGIASGSQNASSSSPFTLWHRAWRLLFRRQPPPSTTPFQKTTCYSYDSRGSPTLSSSMPNIPQANGLSHAVSSSSSQYLSRSPSPAPGSLYEDGLLPNGLSSRSRNASQHSLNTTSLVPRAGTLSRLNSSQQLGSGDNFRDG